LLRDQVRNTLSQGEAFPANKNQDLLVVMLAKVAGDLVRDQFVRFIQHQDARTRLAGFDNKIASVRFVPTPVPPNREFIAATAQRRE
jgi:hypothetical protein